MKNSIIIAMSGIILSLGFAACDSDNVENLYTFKGSTAGQYLNDSTEFSEFYKLLTITGVSSLLDTYGAYTVFAPDNKAMQAFYTLKGKTGLDDFTQDSLKAIAFNHIINKAAIHYSAFRAGRLPELSMSDRYITVSYASDATAGELCFLNKTSQITGKNLEVYNGVIHRIAEVLNPSNFGIVESLRDDPDFSIFYEALVETGMADSLLKALDEGYDPSPYLENENIGSGDWSDFYVSRTRKFGYTVFMESNATLSQYDITDLASMITEAKKIYDAVFPEDAGIINLTDRRNSLNRFISYHLLNKNIGLSKIIDDYYIYTNGQQLDRTGIDMYEYLEPMLYGTLIEVTRKGGTKETNLLNLLDPNNTAKCIHVVRGDIIDATNGTYHEIDGLLVYSNEVNNLLSSKRLRFDAASFFPELANNNMRGAGNTDPNKRFLLPNGYVDRLSSSDQTIVWYLCPYVKYLDFQGDEIWLSAASGKLYDFKLVTPPVPAGTYEVRFGYLSNGKRGVAQLYFDGLPCGVPLNLNTGATDAAIGYIEPGTVTDDPYGYENDKMMRNRGYMKGPACYHCTDGSWQSGKPTESARMAPNSLRRILDIRNFTEATNHVFEVKGLSGGEFMFDFLEFVPTSAIETEDIY